MCSVNQPGFLHVLRLAEVVPCALWNSRVYKCCVKWSCLQVLRETAVFTSALWNSPVYSCSVKHPFWQLLCETTVFTVLCETSVFTCETGVFVCSLQISRLFMCFMKQLFQQVLYNTAVFIRAFWNSCSYSALWNSRSCKWFVKQPCLHVLGETTVFTNGLRNSRFIGA